MRDRSGSGQVRLHLLVRTMFFVSVFVDLLLYRFGKLLFAFSVTSRVCDYLVVGDGRLFARVWG